MDKKRTSLAEGTGPHLRLSSGVCGPLSDIMGGKEERKRGQGEAEVLSGLGYGVVVAPDEATALTGQ